MLKQEYLVFMKPTDHAILDEFAMTAASGRMLTARGVSSSGFWLLAWLAYTYCFTVWFVMLMPPSKNSSRVSF